VLYIDPPYSDTGLGLGYNTLSFDDIFGSIDYDALMNDAAIFIWVTNAMGPRVSNFMASKGWEEKEILTWNKYDKDCEPLFRAGHDMRHVCERLYMFRRAKPTKVLDKWFFERAVPNSIHSIIKNMKIS
jgi:N6-adenosine-specific RNA methylase IME4